MGCKSSTNKTTVATEAIVVDTTSTTNYDWSMQSYGSSKLQFDSPISLEKTDLTSELIESVREVIAKSETYLGMINDSGMLMCNYVVYQPDIPLSLEQAAQGSVNEMLNSVNGDLIEMERKDLEYNGRDAILQLGSAYTNEGSIEFKNLIIVDAPSMWQVTVIYKLEDASIADIASRIIGSVEFE